MTEDRLDDVKAYWESSPLHSIEFPMEEEGRAYFDNIDRMRWEQDRWCVKNLVQFPIEKGKKLLDAGCGIGVFSRYFARRGFDVYGIDLTQKAIDLTQKSFAIYGLKGQFRQASVEALPFEDNYFDFVFSNGVIHHTPDTEKAVKEIHRVLKPGGLAFIGIYYKNILLRMPLFPVMKCLLPIFLKKSQGRELFFKARTPEEFVRVYDGNDTPITRVYSKAEAFRLFADFEVVAYGQHIFSPRFLRFIPDWEFLHKFMDHRFGTIICFLLRK